MVQEAASDSSFNAEDVVIYEFADWQISDIELAMNHICMQIKVIENSNSVSVSIQKQDEEEFDTWAAKNPEKAKERLVSFYERQRQAEERSNQFADLSGEERK